MLMIGIVEAFAFPQAVDDHEKDVLDARHGTRFGFRSGQGGTRSRFGAGDRSEGSDSQKGSCRKEEHEYDGEKECPVHDITLG